MYKRVVAGVVALLMFSSALPLPDFVKSVSDMSITAEAAASIQNATGKFGKEGKSNAVFNNNLDTGVKTVTITLTEEDTAYYFPYSLLSSVTINESDVSNLLSICESSIRNSSAAAKDYSIDGAEIIFSAKFGMKYFPNLAHIYFEDGRIDTITGCFTDHTNLQTVDFGDHITKVGDNTFSGCTAFVGSDSGNTLQLKNVKTIGKGAFRSCKLIEHITFNSDTKLINDNAFNGCTGLKDVELPSEIKDIGASAFGGCTQLTSVTFADGSVINRIGASAFANDTSLKVVDFGLDTTVSVIGDTKGKASTFEKCTALTDVIANGEKNTLPNGIIMESFGSGMFNGCTSLRSFIIPDYLLIVPDTMFSGCTNLGEVVFGDETGESSMCTVIGQGAFKGCTLLNEIVLPETATRINASAFMNCTILDKVVVSDELTTIDGSFGLKGTACKDDDALQAFLKNTLPKISDVNSYKIFTEEPDLYENKYTVYYMTESHDDSDGDVIDPYNYKGGSTFAGSPQIAVYPRSEMDKADAAWSSYAHTVRLPEGVKFIPQSAFAACSNVKNVYLSPKTLSVGNKAFQNCTSLTDIALPDGVIKINKNLFDGCTSLKDVTVSSDLNTIDDYSFQNCKALETLTPSNETKLPYTLQFPYSCAGVQRAGFVNCSSFKYLNFLFDDKGETNFATVAVQAFKGCSSLTGMNIGGKTVDTITMPVKVNVVQESAFQDCTGLKNMVFLGNVTTIDKAAFSGCKNLETVTVNTSLRQIGANAFYNCSSLKYTPQTDLGESSLVNLTTIEDYTFYGCSSLETVEIPANITSIGNNAFAKCCNDSDKDNLTGLTAVYIDKNSKLAKLGNSAFESCQVLELFTTNKEDSESSFFPGALANIGNSAFNKTALKNIIIYAPASGTNQIGTYAFAANTALEFVDLSNSNLTAISANLFNGDTNLKRVTLPDSSVSTIGDAAFSKCNFLHTLGTSSDPDGEYVIPESISTIGNNAFADNFCMQKITIPSKTTDLKLSMFNFNIKEADIVKYGYTPLEDIEVSKDNNSYTSIGGVLFTKDRKTLLCYPFSKVDVYYDIPEETEVLEPSAFAATRFLKGVNVNNKLQTIGKDAFKGMMALEFIDFDLNENTTVTFAATSGVITDGAQRKEVDEDTGKTVNFRIKIYGLIPSTAYDYANTKANTSAVKFVSSAKELKLTDSKGTVMPETARVSNESNTYQLLAEQYDGEGKATKELLLWSSDSESVATVDENGLVTFLDTGTATITVTNQKGTLSKSVKFVIFEAPVITLSETNFLYDGKVHEPEVTVYSGEIKLTQGVDYTVTYQNSKEVSTSSKPAKAIVTGKGNYPFAAKTLTYNIEGITVADATLKLTPAYCIYDGKTQQPAVTVTDKDGKVLTQNTDYTVKYSNNINVGNKALVTVTGKGGYTGTVTAYFTIKPATLDKPTLTTQNGYITAKWVNKATNNTGYQVQIDKTAHFNSAATIRKTLTYADSTKNTAALSYAYFKTGEKWFVRVRPYKTVNGENVYGNWSTYSYIVVKDNVKTVTIPTYVYNNKTLTIAPTVKSVRGTTLKKGTDYTISPATITKAGYYSVKITGKGNYQGTVTKTFRVLPYKVSPSSVTSTVSKKAVFKWRKGATGTAGYQIQYATNASFTANAGTTLVSGIRTLSKTLTLTGGKKYFFRVRPYIVVRGTKFYGAWSGYKYVTVKK